MKLTSKERKLLQQSIDHWQNDIINKFVGGNSIQQFGVRWWAKSKERVRCEANDCPLCIALSDYNDCNKCIYNKYYGYDCDNLQGHWKNFIDKLTKESAVAMRDALQAILDSDKKDNYCRMQFFCTCIDKTESECIGFSYINKSICKYSGLSINGNKLCKNDELKKEVLDKYREGM